MKKIVAAMSFALISMHAFPQGTDHLFYSKERSKRIEIFSTIVQIKLPYLFTKEGKMEEAVNGKLFYSTTAKGGKLNGIWQSWYRDGLSCDSGALLKNVPDGEWKHWNEQGQLLSIRNYNAAKFYQITDEMLRFNPKRNFYSLSRLFQQNRQAAMHYLHFSYSFPGNHLTRNYSSLRELVSANISGLHPYKPVFEQCLQDGLYMNYFADGSIKDSGYYKNGLRYGKWIHRDSSGSDWQQGAYENGHKIKEWKMYNNDNKLLELIFYNNNGDISWRKKIKRPAS